jgi:hypothetical protein
MTRHLRYIWTLFPVLALLVVGGSDSQPVSSNRHALLRV